MLTLKKIAIVTALLFFLSACSNQAQQHNVSKAKRFQPVGVMSSVELITQFSMFSSSYNQYKVKEDEKLLVSKFPDDLIIDIYFGTWCHDSQREVPRLLKSFGNKTKQTINLIALDYQKTEPTGTAKKLGVKYTPTFIVSRGGVEIGRIIERPKQSLIADIQAMLQ